MSRFNRGPHYPSFSFDPDDGGIIVEPCACQECRADRAMRYWSTPERNDEIRMACPRCGDFFYPKPGKVQWCEPCLASYRKLCAVKSTVKEELESYREWCGMRAKEGLAKVREKVKPEPARFGACNDCGTQILLNHDPVTGMDPQRSDGRCVPCGELRDREDQTQEVMLGPHPFGMKRYYDHEHRAYRTKFISLDTGRLFHLGDDEPLTPKQIRRAVYRPSDRGPALMRGARKVRNFTVGVAPFVGAIVGLGFTGMPPAAAFILGIFGGLIFWVFVLMCTEDS